MKTKLCWGLTALFLIGPALLGYADAWAEDTEPLYIVKRAADQEESLLVQDGQLARLNPDGTRVLVSCLTNEQTVTFVNDAQGVYWKGPFEQFAEELHLFMIVHLLQEDPEVMYAVQVRVEEAVGESIAGYPTQHFR